MKLCTVEGCHGCHWAKGLCKRHYNRMHTYGDLDVSSGYCANCGGEAKTSTWCPSCEPTVCTCAEPVRQSGFLREHECGSCRRLLPLEVIEGVR